MKYATGWLLCIGLAGCASDTTVQGKPDGDRYRCENGIAFTVRFVDDSAALNSNRGSEVLYRTAGGLTPSQTVYSNPRMRAEFGLGTTGKEAVVRYLLQPMVVRCVQD